MGLPHLCLCLSCANGVATAAALVARSKVSNVIAGQWPETGACRSSVTRTGHRRTRSRLTSRGRRERSLRRSVVAVIRCRRQDGHRYDTTPYHTHSARRMSYPPQAGQEWYCTCRVASHRMHRYGLSPSGSPRWETSFALSNTPMDDHVLAWDHDAKKRDDRLSHFIAAPSCDLPDPVARLQTMPPD